MKSNLCFELKDYHYLGTLGTCPDNMVIVPKVTYDLIPNKYRYDGILKENIRLFMEPWLLDKITHLQFHIKVREYLDEAPGGLQVCHDTFVNLRGESSLIMELKLIFG